MKKRPESKIRKNSEIIHKITILDDKIFKLLAIVKE